METNKKILSKPILIGLEFIYFVPLISIGVLCFILVSILQGLGLGLLISSIIPLIILGITYLICNFLSAKYKNDSLTKYLAKGAKENILVDNVKNYYL